MEECNKTQDELKDDFVSALNNLRDRLYDLLRYGEYSLGYMSRDYNTQEIVSATMHVGDHSFYLRSKPEEGTEVTIRLPDNPVNEELLRRWDMQTLQNDIDYQLKKLKAMLDLKEKYKT